MKFMEGSGVVQEKTDWILVEIWTFLDDKMSKSS